MAEKIVSPGVFTKEVDQSFLPAGIAAIGAALVGPTVKGPAGVPTVVSSYSEYQQIFGDTFSSGSGAQESSYAYLTSYTAKEYLKHAETLTVVRILAGAYAPAKATISSSTTVGSGIASGKLTILNSHGQTPEDEFQITVGGTETRFIAADPAGGVPVDNGNIRFFATGSDVATTLDNLVAEINTAAIGVTAVDGTTFLALSASSAGTAGNSISVDSGSGTTFSDVLTLAGGTNTTTSTNCFTLTSLNDGAILNSNGPIGTNGLYASGSKDNFKFEVTSVNTAKGSFNLLIRRGDDTDKRKSIIEQYNNLTLDPNTSNFIGKVIGDQTMTVRDSGTNDPFLQLSGSFPNKSKYVRVTTHVTTYNYLDENGNVRDAGLSGSLPTVSSGSFQGGSDGNVQHPIAFYENITNTNMQGYNLGSANDGKTAYEDAIKILKNQDEYDINLILLPGLTDNHANHGAIITQAIDMCEDRGDCFAIVDPASYGSTIATATAKAEGRDSNYAAMYWPWVMIPDNQLAKNVWVPPSVVIPGVYAFNDRVAAEWFAPAGLNRGGIDSATMAERKLTHTNRDTLYESNVNPIATFPNTGVCVWGQKTLQKKASALDRVNVRRLLIAAKKFIASATKFLVFEQNTAATRLRFLNIVNPYLESVQQRQGLYAFKVVMDETNNTPDVIDRNQMVGQLFLQPTKTAEFIIIDFNILPTGAAFPE
tara:strand:- start:1992 stop:4112 length:2121 start_codon:yes stop_codon:yes gene_type:complete